MGRAVADSRSKPNRIAKSDAATPRTWQCNRQALQLFELLACNVKFSLGGFKGGVSLFEKRHPSLTPSQRKFFIASEQLEELQCLPIAPLACGKAAFTPAIRLGVLLLSAAALPISRWYSLISVYRSTHQCGERSNAAFRRQSAANLTSLAPHDSKARLQIGHELQGFMAKPCTPHLHCAARAVLQD